MPSNTRREGEPYSNWNKALYRRIIKVKPENRGQGGEVPHISK